MANYGSGLSGERTSDERRASTASCRGNSTMHTSPHITDPNGYSDLQTVRDVCADRFRRHTRSSGEGSGITRTRSEVNTRPVNARCSMPPSSSNTMPRTSASEWSGMLVDDNLPPWVLQTQPNVSNSIGDHTRSREQFGPRTEHDADLEFALFKSRCDYASSQAPIDPRTEHDADLEFALFKSRCDYASSQAPIDPRTENDAVLARELFERECERVGISDYDLLVSLSRHPDRL